MICLDEQPDAPPSQDAPGAGFFLFRPNSLGVFHYICIDKNLQKPCKNEGKVSCFWS